MDGDDPMTGGPSRVGDSISASYQADEWSQETALRELQAKMSHDMEDIQYKLVSLGQQIEAVPILVSAEMAKSGAFPLRESANWAQEPSPHETAAPAAPTYTASFQQKYDDLHAHSVALERNLDVAQRKLASVETQLRESQKEAQRLSEKEAMFRTIILDQAGVQKVSDDEMLQMFLKLRQDIQKLSSSSSYVAETNPNLAPAPQDAGPSLQVLRDPSAWRGLSVRDRRLRMRAIIFDELHRTILGCRCFGLEEHKSISVPDESRLRTNAIESELRHLERLLEDRGVSDSAISDWRIATIKCVQLSRIREGSSALTADDIFNVLTPLLSHHARPPEEEALRSKILALCQDAFKLRMMMRMSKDRYVVKVMKPGESMSDPAVESQAEAVTVEGGKNSDGSDLISYTMFGALIKHPQAQDQPAHILEKAHVVMVRRVF